MLHRVALLPCRWRTLAWETLQLHALMVLVRACLCGSLSMAAGRRLAMLDLQAAPMVRASVGSGRQSHRSQQGCVRRAAHACAEPPS